MNLAIAVFSDVICPWCFVGKRRLERALDEMGLEADIRWLPFELNPDMPPDGMERADYRVRKFGPEKAALLDRDMTALGLEEGIAFAFDRMERTPNTRRAHLLVGHASRHGRGAEAAEALFRAYFEEARDIGDPDVLLAVAGSIGLDRDRARTALGDPALDTAVQNLEDEAGRLGVAGVPFFLVNEAGGVSGAQPPAVWREILGKIPAGGTEVPVG
jgi:predicted DsbA family dithiol-disulfide isomerase